MRLMRARFDFPSLLVPGLLTGALFAGCGSDDLGVPPDEPSLDDFLPDIPEPSGEPQGAWAGEITADADEIVPGPASTAMPGDYFMRNSRGRFVIGAPTRVVSIIPQGGNLIGAAPLDEDGEVIVGDHFGKLSFAYLLGRTCEPDSLEIIRDGSGGGAAVLRARGKATANDYINMRGIGLLNVPRSLNPDLEDGVECAVTYTLEPDSPVLQVRWTLFNPGEGRIRGPFASLANTGGDVEAFAPARGFETLGLDALTSPDEGLPADYVVYQGPGVSYGVIPAHEELDTPNTHLFVAGVSILLFNGSSLLDLLNEDTFYLELPGQTGVTHGVDFTVGRDAADVEAQFLNRREVAAETVSGTVTWASAGQPVPDARVGIFQDVSQSGEITPDDSIRTFVDTAEDGSFEAQLAPGDYLLRVDVRDQARSEIYPISVPGDGGDLSIELPDPVVLDFTVTDGATGSPIPARLAVIGEHPALPVGDLFDPFDRVSGVVRTLEAIRGTSVIGSELDPPLVVPAGSTYRVIATRGTEWSYDSVVVEAEAGQEPGELEFELWRVAEPEGYVSSEYHVHAIGSPDSPVPEETRVMTAAADGVEVFAQTDHDVVSDLQPVIEELGLASFVRAIPGVEVTPFVYGHFNAFPLEPDPSDPTGGAIDWARGDDGYSLLPGEIFEAARERGADVVQVNHPRSTTGLANFMHYFDRAGLAFDYEQRMILGDPSEQPVPNEWLRLPGETSLWDDRFDAFEVWNGFEVADLNEDGVRDLTRLDLVMADWFNFLSFGLDVTPIGSSDTHTITKDPMGMPRTYVRVTDDSPVAIETGRVVDDIIATLTGDGVPTDVVLTNGPHVEIRVDGEPALGRVVEADDGEVTLQIRAIAPSWAHLDTLELHANATPPVGNHAEALQPLACFTSRDEPSEPCADAAIPGTLEVNEVELLDGEGNPTGVTYLELEQEITLSAADIETREGAVSDDAWIVVRARGNRGIFPAYINQILNASNLEIFVSGTDEERAAVLEERGVPATALTAPVYVDFDGGGYVAPFSP